MDCSLVYQKWIGDEELLTTLYGSWIEDHCRPEHDPQYQNLLANAMQSRDAHEILVAASFIGRSPRHMVTLDYGMGWGPLGTHC